MTWNGGLSYVVRTLLRSPGFAASAIVALALGIGANTAVFSVVYAVLLKPLPYERPNQLVRLSERRINGNDTERVSIGTFVDWRARTHALAGVAAFTRPGDVQALWAVGDRLETVKTSSVSPALFSILGVAPAMGRTFRPEAEQDRPAGDRGDIVISDALWHRVFGGATDVIGRTVRIEDRTPARIIGVMPRGFAFPETAEAWVSLSFVTTIPPARRRAQSLLTIGRLRSGETIESARADLSTISAQLAKDQPASNAGWTAQVRPLAGSDTAEAKPALIALFGAVVGVLLISCASVAHLMLARASTRRREFAVRLALGAGTWRLVGLCLMEAIVLAVGGTAVGVLWGSWLSAALVRFAPADIPRLGEVGLNGPLLWFAASVGVLSAMLTSIAPAVQAVRADRAGVLRPDTRGATMRGAAVRRLLIGGEVAIVVLLLTGALLMLRTFVKLRDVDLGFQTDHVVFVSTRWPLGRVFPSTPGVLPWSGIQSAVDGLLESVASVPGVESVGLIADVPLTDSKTTGAVWRADAAGASAQTPPTDSRDRWTANLTTVTGGYFSAMGIPILRGRNFSHADRFSDQQLNNPSVPRTGVVIVNNAFASRYFPGEDPVGHTVVVSDDRQFGPLKTIVGVAGDARDTSVADAALPAMFIPHGQHPDVFMPSLVVRSSLPVDAIAGPLTAHIEQVRPPLLVRSIQPMQTLVSGALARPRFNLILLAAFALVALVLSAVGIYGVLAALVAQRTREIGIRVALGARAADVMRLVLTEGMMPVIVGVGGGLATAALATQALRTMLYGVAPLDGVSFVAAPLLLTAIGFAACYLPSRRATRVDPVVALREE